MDQGQTEEQTPASKQQGPCPPKAHRLGRAKWKCGRDCWRPGTGLASLYLTYSGEKTHNSKLGETEKPVLGWFPWSQLYPALSPSLPMPGLLDRVPLTPIKPFTPHTPGPKLTMPALAPGRTSPWYPRWGRGRLLIGQLPADVCSTANERSRWSPEAQTPKGRGIAGWELENSERCGVRGKPQETVLGATRRGLDLGKVQEQSQTSAQKP